MGLSYSVQVQMIDTAGNHIEDWKIYRNGLFARPITLEKAEENYRNCVLNYPELNCRLISVTSEGILFEVLKFRKGRIHA